MKIKTKDTVHPDFYKLNKIKEIDLGSECNSLKFGVDWDETDIDKPHILIESVFGDSHPGSVHLDQLVGEASIGIYESGGRPLRFTVTDVCDGINLCLMGVNYSLLSREFIASMVEIHAVSEPSVGLLFISSCDKSIPGHLSAAARINLPTIFIPGGAQTIGTKFLSVDKLWNIEDEVKKEKRSLGELLQLQLHTCPSAGACQSMGTASTMQSITEALGLALPWSALIPATNYAIKRNARNAGRLIKNLIKKGIRVKDIVTKESLENAIMVHAAICGSANAVIHIIAFAEELGININIDLFDKINRKVPYIADIWPVGKYPTELFWYAGGIPMIMNEIRDLLHLDVLTCNGKTLKDNLNDFINNEYKRKAIFGYLENFGLETQQIIKKADAPLSKEGSLAVLKGNLCPNGGLIKHAGVSPEMYIHTGDAKVFDNEDEALSALVSGFVQKGDVIILRYQGPRANGAPEMFRIGEYIGKRPILSNTTAIITDGRYSGNTKGPAIGYVTPEAYEGGYFALVTTGDLIKIDIPNRQLNIIGVKDDDTGIFVEDKASIKRIMEMRSKKWKMPKISFPEGALSLYRKLAQPLLTHGGRINYL